MLVSRFVKLTLAAAILLGQPVFAQSSCTPSVRREWRSLTPSERTEWIDAVKVKHSVQRHSRKTDASAPSVSTGYLTALLWSRPLTLPTPSSHPSTQAALTLTVR